MKRIVPGVLLLALACGEAESELERIASQPEKMASEPLAHGFADRAREQGLTFYFQTDSSAEMRLYEAMGGGVALFDADGDGDLDAFLPGGGSAPATPGATTLQGLFRNDGSGRFADVTTRSGLSESSGGYAIGAAADDVDGDEDLDLFVATIGGNRLYLNDGQGGFERSPRAPGGSEIEWTSAAVFFDADGDGDPDLYTAGYVRYDPQDELPCNLAGERISCTPDLFSPGLDHFYRNLDGSFVEEPGALGVHGIDGKGLAVAAIDVDGDADLDLYVADDITPNLLLINDGSGNFVEDGLLRGVAFGRHGQEQASMGVAIADLDREHGLDLVVSNFSSEEANVFLRTASGLWTEVADRVGVGRPTFSRLGFGVVAVDFDLDGWVDLAFANGHIYNQADRLLPGSSYRQPNDLFKNRRGRFEPWASWQGGLAGPDVGRGLAAGDLDSDGDVDLVLSRVDGPAGLFVNGGTPTGSWLAVRPLLATGMPAFGATAVLETDSGPRLSPVVAGGSYASMSEPVARFGLAPEDRPRHLEVHWPGGAKVRFIAPPDRRVLVARPPQDGARPL